MPEQLRKYILVYCARRLNKRPRSHPPAE